MEREGKIYAYVILLDGRVYGGPSGPYSPSKKRAAEARAKAVGGVLHPVYGGRRAAAT
jgi:hypothetical protein